MDELRRYVIGVAAAALLCGILTRLTKNCAAKEMIRMICGVFMTIVLIQPILGKKQLLFYSAFPEIREEAEALCEEGASAGGTIKREFIKQRVEAYISSRAEAMGAVIQASVSLGEDSIPVSVSITGSVSPLCKNKLTQIIASELGIPREQQEWIG